MKGKLTLAQVRVLLLLGAVLLIVLTYFLVFQRNMDQASDYDAKTQKENERILYLTSLESKVQDLDIYTSLYTDDIDKLIQSFPVKLTQQKSVYLIFNLMIDSGITIESISPGEPVPFYYKGQVLDSASAQNQAQVDSEGQNGEQKETLSEITPVPMEEMIGSKATYTLNVSGTTKQIFKALDWIRDNEDERMSVGSVSLQFDSGTGKLKGSIALNFYCMLGNGVPYKDPDMSIFKYGMDKIFGEFSN